MGYIHPAVSEICDPQSLDLICGKFDKFLAHGQAHMGQMGKWPWQCTTRGLDNSTELRMEKIHQEVTEIWVPQVWQPPAQPPTRPPARTMMTIPLQPRGLRGKNYFAWDPEIRNTVDFHYISVQYSWWVTSVYAFVCKQEVRQKTPRNFILFTVAHLRYFIIQQNLHYNFQFWKYTIYQGVRNRK